MIVSHEIEMIVRHEIEMIATETIVRIDHHEVVVDAAVVEGADAVAWEAEQI